MAPALILNGIGLINGVAGVKITPINGVYLYPLLITGRGPSYMPYSVSYLPTQPNLLIFKKNNQSLCSTPKHHLFPIFMTSVLRQDKNLVKSLRYDSQFYKTGAGVE